MDLKVLSNTLLLITTVAIVVSVLGVALSLTLYNLSPKYRIPLFLGLIIPAAVPSYVYAIIYRSIFGPTFSGLFGSTIVLSIATLPIILITTYNSLELINPNTLDAARNLGKNPLNIARTIIFPQIRGGLFSGLLISTLYILNDYGTVSLMNFNTFAREIFIKYSFSSDRTALIGISIQAIMFSIVIHILLRLLKRKSTTNFVSINRAPSVSKIKPTSIIFSMSIIVLSVITPISYIFYRLQITPKISLESFYTESIMTILLSSILIIGFIFVIRLIENDRLQTHISNLLNLAYSLPSVVIGITLIHISITLNFTLYQTLTILILSYIIKYSSIAYNIISESLNKLKKEYSESASLLGKNKIEVKALLGSITSKGYIAAFIICFVTIIKELPLTLLLAPPEYKAISTDIWFAYEDAFFSKMYFLMCIIIMISIIIYISSKFILNGNLRN